MTIFGLSLKKHGLYSPTNTTGYKVEVLEHTSDLDSRETYWIHHYAMEGYQLRNNTTGSQSTGKTSLDVSPRKGYRQGVEYGYQKALRDINQVLDTGRVVLSARSDKSLDTKALAKLTALLGRR